MIASNVIDLAETNRRVREDPAGLIAECESRYSDAVSHTADMIIDNMANSPVVLLAGPSGSGKTTTAFRIEEELERRGIITHFEGSLTNPSGACRSYSSSSFTSTSA